MSDTPAWMRPPPDPAPPAPEIDTSVPHSARVWNYWLGGKDNYAVDRAVGDQVLAAFPALGELARLSRAYLIRVVEYLAGEAGIRQFLDVGTGLPTDDNTHEVAQRAAPESQVVYVDNDPLVLTHARALLTSAPQGNVAYVDADLREPDRIIAAAADSLDLDRPVALMLMGILGHITETDEARTIVRRLLEPLPSGSYLAMCDSTDVIDRDGMRAAASAYNEGTPVPYHLRTPDEIAGFFDGLELVEPGIVSCPRWRPRGDKLPAELDQFGGVGRKP